jgi:hypothetical protein
VLNSNNVSNNDNGPLFCECLKLGNNDHDKNDLWLIYGLGKPKKYNWWDTKAQVNHSP